MVVHESSPSLTKPDPIVGGASLFRVERRIVPRAVRGCACDVSRDTNVYYLGRVLLRTAGRLPTLRIRAAISDTFRQQLLCAHRKLVPHWPRDPHSTRC